MKGEKRRAPESSTRQLQLAPGIQAARSPPCGRQPGGLKEWTAKPPGSCPRERVSRLGRHGESGNQMGRSTNHPRQIPAHHPPTLARSPASSRWWRSLPRLRQMSPRRHVPKAPRSQGARLLRSTKPARRNPERRWCPSTEVRARRCYRGGFARSPGTRRALAITRSPSCAARPPSARARHQTGSTASSSTTGLGLPPNLPVGPVGQ